MLICFYDSSGYDYFDGNWVAYWVRLRVTYVLGGQGKKSEKHNAWEGLYDIWMDFG